MRPIVIAGNWKMHTDLAGGAALAAAVREGLQGGRPPDGVQVLLCPPFIHLDTVRGVIDGSGVGLGAQNVHYEADGAYTGEVSASMLRSAGCSHVIIGHSERRQYFHETDDTVNRRVRAALGAGFTPIVCVGETLDERNAGITGAVIERQTRGALAGLAPSDVAALIIAYEPVWAIGTGVTATPAQAQEVHVALRRLVADVAGGSVAEGLVIQYGGSMKPDNAAELLAQPDVDGGLIGGASLNAAAFLSIVAAAGRRAAERRSG